MEEETILNINIDELVVDKQYSLYELFSLLILNVLYIFTKNEVIINEKFTYYYKFLLYDIIEGMLNNVLEDNEKLSI